MQKGEGGGVQIACKLRTYSMEGPGDCICNNQFDIPFILVCNRISLIPFNNVQSQLLLCFKMDQVLMELSTKPLTYKANQSQTTVVYP